MIEILNPQAHANNARVAIFDFDGTISLVRAGWEHVMIPMMVEILLETPGAESEAELTAVVTEYVGALTGRQTIYQMIEFTEQIKKRGGESKDPLEYKHQYLDALNARIKDRVDSLESGAVQPVDYHVPGVQKVLDVLKDRGFVMYLASGTDQPYMRREARLLGVYDYFDGGVFGALDDYKSFSKKILIEKIIRESEFAGEEFIGFGDGFVEIQNVKEVGGVAVGVASDEPECRRIEPTKRDRLAGVGADWIVPSFAEHDELVGQLFPS